jgi:hypothetical protein
VGAYLHEESPQVSALKKLWWGLQPLPTAFWGYYIGGGIVVVLGVSVLGVLLVLLLPVARPFAYAIGACIVWAYWITAAIGVWRSASVAGAGWLLILAKSVVGLLAAIFVVRMLTGGAIDFVAVIVGTWNGTYPAKGVGFPH